jgi:hypothetical protein
MDARLRPPPARRESAHLPFRPQTDRRLLTRHPEVNGRKPASRLCRSARPLALSFSAAKPTYRDWFLAMPIVVCGG